MFGKLKIGIITIVKVNNYGAELQAFALQKKLNSLGYDSEIIDYLFYKNKRHKKEKASRSFTSLGINRKLKEFLYPIKVFLNTYSYRRNRKIREYKFEEFHQKYTKFSSQIYCRYSDLYNACLDYDIYIVGSDQVWNPYSNTSLAPYFLTFAPKDKLKISYASSFGVSSIPSEVKSHYKALLNNIDFLSVREKQGCNIIESITGRDSQHVLDPTLLLNAFEWNECAERPENSLPEKYILLYVLKESTYITDIARTLAKKESCGIVRICREAVAEDTDKSIVNIIDAGPGEFLYLFSNATFVLTNSFHGTAFSVNYEKPFFSVVSSKKNNNSRLESLLNLLKLEERLIVEGTSIDSLPLIELNYNEASEILEKEREKSVSFLQDSINH